MRETIPERDVHMFVNGLVRIVEGISHRVEKCDLCGRQFNSLGATVNIIEDGAGDTPPWMGYTICPRCLQSDRAEVIATLADKESRRRATHDAFLANLEVGKWPTVANLKCVQMEQLRAMLENAHDDVARLERQLATVAGMTAGDMMTEPLPYRRLPRRGQHFPAGCPFDDARSGEAGGKLQKNGQKWPKNRCWRRVLVHMTLLRGRRCYPPERSETHEMQL